LLSLHSRLGSWKGWAVLAAEAAATGPWLFWVQLFVGAMHGGGVARGGLAPDTSGVGDAPHKPSDSQPPLSSGWDVCLRSAVTRKVPSAIAVQAAQRWRNPPARLSCASGGL
jgi:hypothetical protein